MPSTQRTIATIRPAMPTAMPDITPAQLATLRTQRVRRAVDQIGRAEPRRRALAFAQCRSWMEQGGRTPGQCLDAWTAATQGMMHDAHAAGLWADAVVRAAMMVALTSD